MGLLYVLIEGAVVDLPPEYEQISTVFPRTSARGLPRSPGQMWHKGLAKMRVHEEQARTDALCRDYTMCWCSKSLTSKGISISHL